MKDSDAKETRSSKRLRDDAPEVDSVKRLRGNSTPREDGSPPRRLRGSRSRTPDVRERSSERRSTRQSRSRTPVREEGTKMMQASPEKPQSGSPLSTVLAAVQSDEGVNEGEVSVSGEEKGKKEAAVEVESIEGNVDLAKSSGAGKVEDMQGKSSEEGGDVQAKRSEALKVIEDRLKKLRDGFEEKLIDHYFMHLNLSLLDETPGKVHKNAKLLQFLKENSIEKEKTVLPEIIAPQAPVMVEPPKPTPPKASVKATPKVQEKRPVRSGTRTPVEHAPPAKNTASSGPSSPKPTPVPKTKEGTPGPGSGVVSGKAGAERTAKTLTGFSVLDMDEEEKKQALSKAKEEAALKIKVSEFKRDGIWLAKKLPKLYEKPGEKTHWDMLLDEMAWLSCDFAMEKRFKIAVCKKISKAVLHYHSEKKIREDKKFADTLGASGVSKTMVEGVGSFWRRMENFVFKKLNAKSQKEKLVTEKERTSDLVAQSEKFSSLLLNGLKKKVEDAHMSEAGDYPYTTAIEEIPGDMLILPSEEVSNVESEVKTLKKEGVVPISELGLKTDSYLGVNGVSESFEKECKDETSEAKGKVRESQSAESPDADQVTPAIESAASDVRDSFTSTPSVSSLISSRSDSPDQADKSQDDSMTILKGQPLMPFQKAGASWLYAMASKGVNCILSDESGMGKDVQVLAYFANLICNGGVWGPHLVIVPASSILKWESSIRKWCPFLNVVTYYGIGAERSKKKLTLFKNEYHVCLTTYKLASNEHFFFREKKWHTVVLDEGHYIDNFNSEKWKSILAFQCWHRILLADFVLPDDTAKLWSLIRFVIPFVFHSQHNMDIGYPTLKAIFALDDRVTAERLKASLLPFILRRTHSEVSNQFPSRKEYAIICPLSKRQASLYKEILLERSSENDDANDVKYLSKVLAKLRNVCNHPELYETRMPRSGLFMGSSISYKAPGTIMDISANSKMLLPALCLLHYEKMCSSSIDSLKDLKIAKEKSSNFHVTVPDENGFDKKISIWRNSRIDFLFRVSEQRCGGKFVFPENLIQMCSLTEKQFCFDGHGKPLLFKTLDDRRLEMFHILRHLFVIIPSVKALSPELIVSHRNPSFALRDSSLLSSVKSTLLDEYCAIDAIQKAEGPEVARPSNLIYDCVKLRKFFDLLYTLSKRKKKVLILSHTCEMLTIIEKCLAYKRHSFVRLECLAAFKDRRYLLDTFNNDSKVMNLVMSTRCAFKEIGSFEVDAVVMYDVEWDLSVCNANDELCSLLAAKRHLDVYRLICDGAVEKFMFDLRKSKKVGDNVDESLFYEDLYQYASEKLLQKDFKVSELKYGDTSKLVKRMLTASERIEDAKALSLRTKYLKEMKEEFFDPFSSKVKQCASVVAPEAAESSRSAFDKLASLEKYACSFLETNEAVSVIDLTKSIPDALSDDEAQSKLRLIIEGNLAQEEKMDVDDSVLFYEPELAAHGVFIDNTEIYGPPLPAADLIREDPMFCVYSNEIMNTMVVPTAKRTRKRKKKEEEPAKVEPPKPEAEPASSVVPEMEELLGAVKAPKKKKKKAKKESAKAPKVGVDSGISDEMKATVDLLAKELKASDEKGGKARLKKKKNGALFTPKRESGTWSIDEDLALKNAVEKYSLQGIHNWDLIGSIVSLTSKMMGRNVSSFQCRDRWVKVVRYREETDLQRAATGESSSSSGRIESTDDLVKSDNGESRNNYYSSVIDSVEQVSALRAQPPSVNTSDSVVASHISYQQSAIEAGFVNAKPSDPSTLSEARLSKVENEEKNRKDSLKNSGMPPTFNPISASSSTMPYNLAVLRAQMALMGPSQMPMGGAGTFAQGQQRLNPGIYGNNPQMMAALKNYHGAGTGQLSATHSRQQTQSGNAGTNNTALSGATLGTSPSPKKKSKKKIPSPAFKSATKKNPSLNSSVSAQGSPSQGPSNSQASMNTPIQIPQIDVTKFTPEQLVKYNAMTPEQQRTLQIKMFQQRQLLTQLKRFVEQDPTKKATISSVYASYVMRKFPSGASVITQIYQRKDVAEEVKVEMMRKVMAKLSMNLKNQMEMQKRNDGSSNSRGDPPPPSAPSV
eukprot:Nk52_evm121s226 gene=Nk52_evmTU121s226